MIYLESMAQGIAPTMVRLGKPGRAWAQPQGEHKASPLPWYGFASRSMHGGKGTFLSLHPEISLYVSFASRVILRVFCFCLQYSRR